jgi:signal transduction histidine kinase
VAAVLLGLAALAVQVIALLSAGSQSWATADLAWTLAGVVTLVATLAAGLRVGSHRAVRAAWQLYAAAAGCWIVGALIRDSATTGHLGTAADLWQLAFPLFCILSFARRVPRAYIFVLFMLDAIPVILLILAIIWTVEVGARSRPFVLLYPALYVLLAANAIQTIGMHQDLRRVPGTVWLFTLGFCTMALASLFWGAVTMRNGSALAHWAGALWTVGLLLVSAGALLRVWRPTGFLALLPVEKQSGPHALPPAAAVLGLIVLLTVTPRPGPPLRGFMFSAALVLLVRVYLVHRQDVQLIAEVRRSREQLEKAASSAHTNAERLRLLAVLTARLKSLILDELLEAVCNSGLELVGARYAAFGLAPKGSAEFTRFITTGASGPARARVSGPGQGAQPPGAIPRPAGPVQLAGPTRYPEMAGFPPGHQLVEGFLGVPVAIGDSGQGMLYLAGKQRGFSEEDETLAELLATGGGHAIANAELYAESQAQRQQLTVQNERLQELDQLKDEFIAAVSHELRTPLTSIIGYVELMGEEHAGELSPDQRKFAQVIGRNAERLLHLVGDLLFLSRIQSGEMAMEFRGTDLVAIATGAVEGMRPEAQRRHVDLILSATAVPCFAGDPARIAQLLDNLISNAVKFTPEAGKVEVKLGVDGDHAVLAVTDTGMGIPADDRERIFERFFRTESATRQAVPGTGLGLTISKAIVEAHEGTIAIDSEQGRGTTFRVCLPLRPVPAGNGPYGRPEIGGRPAQCDSPGTGQLA